MNLNMLKESTKRTLPLKEEKMDPRLRGDDVWAV